MDSVNDQTYFKYWGKADKEGNYHLLPYHCLDVAAVGWHLLEPDKPLCTDLAGSLGIAPTTFRAWFCFCLALHDVGKFSRAFQGLAPNLSKDLVAAKPQMSYNKGHDSLGFLIWDEMICELWIRDKNLDTKGRYLKPWLEVVTGHHGIPPETGLSLPYYFLDEDKIATWEFFTHIQEIFLKNTDLSFLSDKNTAQKTKELSWQLAGIAVLSDWLGSSREFFKYESNPIIPEQYWENTALPSAELSLKSSLYCPVPIEPYQNIQQLFPFIKTPTPLQEYAMEVELFPGPQVFMLEDVTGAGKTEAALTLVHRIMTKGLADSLYVGLPTMATANGMYRRLAKAYRKLYKPGLSPSLVLAHGTAQYKKEFTDTVILTEQAEDMNYDQKELSASAFCSAWIADRRKKSLLADVGVGTIDQVLLSVLPAKHQSLRLLGLSRKILLIDEVHAYDSYMQKLLETLLEAHARQGGNVILLSATLPNTMRNGLAKAFMKGRNKTIDEFLPAPYPLVTQLPSPKKPETQVSTRKEVEREVQVITLNHEEQVLDVIRDAVDKNLCVCWVRNTVKTARNSMDKVLKIKGVSTEKTMLFHSRFSMIDRQTIENKTLDLFGKVEVNQRAKQVLVATQVVEQSLDLDFDVLISDIAPVDLIIQRAGRLHRHVRDIDGNLLADGESDEREQPILYLLTPAVNENADEDWLKSTLPGTEYVYPDLGQLWLTAKLLTDKKCLKMPDDARELIEGVYGQNAQNEMPEVLQDVSFGNKTIKRSMRGMASLNTLKLDYGYTRRSAEDNSGWDEDVNIPTRLAEVNHIVALARIKDNELVPYAVLTDESESTLWAMSCISLQENDWEKAQTFIADQWMQKIEKLKNNLSCLRWVDILPITAETEKFYSPVLGWNGV